MDVLSVLLQQRTRSIGTVIPDVVITERHSDMLEITEHPVEMGAPISDHAFKRPSEIVMEVGFSGGGAILDFSLLQSITPSIGKSPKQLYQDLLDLQEQRTPIDVITGKRAYKNMLIRGLEVTTDRHSENVLMATITLREVFISQTQTSTVADKQDMAQGVNTSAVKNSGVKNPMPIENSSVGNQLFGGVKTWLISHFR